ncbi:MAG: acyl carrier protein [Deltaproteobacteria bacterium]|jgi:acyl carrier protein|nr:acyl carrier protein [SAR324 cluster bacterium]MEC7191955.1 acyl carrier protein [SAR324 cluster bacterium]MEC7218106.1 acyl carrier protein [SAR324 cluster bacterium]|tara:strand:+ start:208 stop:465 length:258 start_codon:yes stop_codon:yes gene_type:complete
MQLSEEKIREVCLKTIARELDLPLEEVKLDSNLRDDLDLTSLDAMNVIMALEDEFGQEADIEQILELQTVQQLVDYLLSLLQQPK